MQCKIKIFLKLLLFLFFLFSFKYLEAKEEWQLLKSTHFFIYYQDKGKDTVNDLAQKAESCYNTITDELGFNRFNFWTWDNRARIYLFDSQDDYRKDTGANSWSAGQAYVSGKLIKTFVTAPGFLENILPHEMAHIIFREMVGFNNYAVPIWLDEGVATFQEKNFPFLKSDLAAKIRGGGFIALADLEKFNAPDTTDKKSAELFYAESYSLVRYLISEFGKERFVFFCQALRDTMDLKASFSRAYSFSNLAKLETGWKDYILR